MNKAPIDPRTMYYVMNWDTGLCEAEYTTPGAAKKHARSMGYRHTALGGNMPIAYVTADYFAWHDATGTWSTTEIQRCCFYNPCF